jgi:hypothetical protein
MERILDLDTAKVNKDLVKEIEVDNRFNTLDIEGMESPVKDNVKNIYSKKNAPISLLPVLDIYTKDYKIDLVKQGAKIYLLIATLHDGNRFVFLSENDNDWSPIGEFYNRDLLLPLDKSPLTVGLISLIKESPSQWANKSFTYKIKPVESQIKKRR